MKAEYLMIGLIVAILILSQAIATIITPIINHYWAKYQHHRMIENRRQRFYSELKMLMRS